MRKRSRLSFGAWILGLAVLCLACAAQDVTNQQQGNCEGCEERSAETPTEIAQQEEIQAKPEMSEILPFTSAINPCNNPEQKRSESELAYLLDQARAIFAAKEASEWLKQADGSIPIRMEKNPNGGVMGYKVTTAQGMPVVVASLGLGFNDLVAHGILWYENGAWHAQPYPQTAEDLAKQREKAFTGGPFCGGNVLEAHPVDDKLLVLVEHGRTQAGQEVHLLQYKEGKWEVVWAPSYRSWEELHMTIIEIAPDKQSFTAHKTDIRNPDHQWNELWQLQNDKYEKAASTE